MASSSFFGRREDGGRHLGSDFDLLAKWSRAFALRPPIHSYYLTQLSDDERAQLFSGPAQEFRLEEGPDNTVKLETVQDEVNRIDPDVIDMIRSEGYQLAEKRYFEICNEVEDAHDEAEGAAALVLSNALLQGMDGPPAEELARQVANKVRDDVCAKVRGRWKAERDARLMDLGNDTADSSQPAGAGLHDSPAHNTVQSTAPIDEADFVAGLSGTLHERLASRIHQSVSVALEGSLLNKTVSGANIATAVDWNSAEFDSNHTTPQQKPAVKFASPHPSIPDYGSETSADSAQWNSPRYSIGDSPSSPDLDSSTFGPYDDSDGGVTLLPSSLAEALGIKHDPNASTPTPASRFTHTHTQVFEGHLGTGLSQAFVTVPTGVNDAAGGNSFGNLLNDTSFSTATSFTNFGAIGSPVVTHRSHSVNNFVGQHTSVAASSSPFSPTSKATKKYHVAKEQPWTGFTCYEVSVKLSIDQLVPKYWTSKREKERYVRHKIGELKLDDAKLRSDRFSGSVARNPVHIFIDLSNIIIGFYDSMKESRGIPVNKRVMAPAFSFKNFDTILTRDRNVAKRIVAGSLSNSYKRWPTYMLEAQGLKYEMNILERVPKPASPVRKRKGKAGTRDFDAPASGADTSGEDCFVGPMKHGEQGVDELLHLKILQSAMDTPHPATMVLATGDAATAQYSDGFKKNIERVLSHGWNIELYGWSRNISSAWREPEFAEQWGHQFKIIELDGFCEELFDMTIESLEH